MTSKQQEEFGEQMRALREAFEQHRNSTAEYRKESADRQQTMIDQQREIVQDVRDVKKVMDEIDGLVQDMDKALRGNYENPGMVGRVNMLADSQSAQKKWIFMIGSTVVLAVLGAILRKVIQG